MEMNFAFWHQLVKKLPYSKKLLRVRILRFCGYSMKYGGVASFGGTTEQSTKVFSTKFLFQSISEVFSHESFLLFEILKKPLTELPLNTGTVQPDLFSVSHDHAELLICNMFHDHLLSKLACAMALPNTFRLGQVG